MHATFHSATLVTIGRWPAVARWLPDGRSALAAVLTLALGMTIALCGIAAGTGLPRAAVDPEHSMLHIVGRRPLDVGAGPREAGQPGLTPGAISLSDLMAWRRDPALLGVEAAERLVCIVELAGQTQRLVIWHATPPLFKWLALSPPLAGRTPLPMTSADAAPDGAIEVALSASQCARWFERPADAIGRQATLDGQPAVIVGVLPDPPGDAFAGIHAWIAMDENQAQHEQWDDSVLDPATTPYLTGLAVPVDLDDLDRVQAPAIAPLLSVVLGPRVLMALRLAFGASLLLYGASVIAASMLWRAALAERRSELALRKAMGATTAGLQLEQGAQLALMGAAALGLACLGAWWITDLLRPPLLGTLPGVRGLSLSQIAPKWLAMLPAFAAGSLWIVGAPVIGSARASWCVRTMPAVGSGSGIGPGTGSGAGRWRWLDDVSVAWHALVAAASLAIALGMAGLAADAAREPAGFDTAGVGAMTVALPWWRIEGDHERWQMVTDALKAVSGVPSLAAVAAADNAPIAGPEFLAIPVSPSPAAAHAAGLTDAPAPVLARLRSVTPEALPALGVRERMRLTDPAASGLLGLYQGDFPPLPAIISTSLARALYGDDTRALGRLLVLGEQGVPALVLAIVDDTADSPDAFDAGGPALWMPMPLGWESPTWSLLVRLDGPSGPAQRAQAERAIRDALHAVLPGAAADPVVWLDDRVADRARIYVASAGIVLGGALVALALAVMAAIGRTRLAVLRRLDELRLLSAFGRTRWALVGRVVVPAMVGGACGAAAGGGTAGWLARQLLEVPGAAPLGPPAVLPAALVTLAIVLACLAAARVSRIDAAALLRST
jgi:hypothetical protein